MSGGNFNISYKNKAGTGYQIQVATDKKFKNTVIDEKVNGTKTIKYTQDVAKLSTSAKEKPTYYARVRVYFTYGDVTTYSTWSKVKSFTAK